MFHAQTSRFALRADTGPLRRAQIQLMEKLHEEPKPELTGAEGPVLVHPEQELCRGPAVHAEQLEPRRGDGGEAVELEGEEDGLRPRPLLAVPGVP